MCYLTGSCKNVLPLSTPLGLAAMKESAESGNAKAQHSLGELYLYGIGVDQNLTRAVDLFEQSAAQNNPDAYYSLAECYANGVGVYQNIDKSNKMFKIAYDIYYDQAKVEDYEAIEKVANCLFYGYGVDKDVKKAIELYTLAVSFGSTSANEKIGDYYREKDRPKKALQNYIRSAKLGYSATKTLLYLNTSLQEHTGQYARDLIQSIYFRVVASPD